jgi:hypothetical protein
MKINRNKYTGIPPQKLLDSAKDKEWVKANFEGHMFIASSSTNGRSSRYEKQVLYDLVNSKFNEEDFKHVVDPYGFKDDIGEQPAVLQNYNIIRDKIELLKGEEAKLPFNWNVVGSYGEVIREKDEMMQQEILSLLQNVLFQKMQAAAAQSGQEGEEQEPIEAPELGEVQKKYKLKYLDIREKNASHIIKQAFEKENLKDKFNDGWEHALISAEEIYYVSKHKGRPAIRVVNPLNSDYDKDPDLKYIQKGNWFREERLMSAGSILDEYGEFLTDEDVKALDEKLAGSSLHAMYRNSQYFSNTGPNPKYQPGEPFSLEEGMNPYNPTSGHNINSNPSDGFVVTTLVWRSMRRMDYLTYIDENGESQTQYVEQTFSLNSEQRKAGWKIDSTWISDIWKCTGINAGEDPIIVDYGPIENQTGDLPYIGYVYNNTNSKATSLVDLVKSHQYTYMIIMYKIMTEVAKFKGAKLIFDIAQIPTTGVNGMSQEKWLYYFDVIGIGWVNSFEEGKEGSSTGQRASFNQFQMVQDTTLNAIAPLVQMLDKIENQVQAVLGVSDQRLGAIGSSETVGGVERSVIQSSAITASLFMKHNQVKKAVLQQVLDVAKLCLLEDNDATQLMVDDVYRELVKIDAQKLNDSEYEVLVSDSIEIASIKESLKALAPQAIQGDKLNYSEYIRLLQSNSISEIASIIKQGEDDKYERDSSASKAQQEQHAADLAEKKAQFERNLEYQITKDQLDRENKIQVATISSLRGKDGPSDMNMNGIPDPMEASRLAMEQQKIGAQQQIESMKLQTQMEKNQMDMADRSQKNELAARKLQLEEAKLHGQFSKDQTALKLQSNENAQQNQHKKLDLQENAKDRALKLKELDKKEKIEKFKVKHKPKPNKKK